MISFKKYHATYSLLTEAKAKKSSGHLTHLEELMLTKGESGYDEARDTLLRMLSKLQGRSKRNIDTTVKWDGAPFIMAGKITKDMDDPRIPFTGRHFVATKSGITNKVPKVNDSLLCYEIPIRSQKIYYDHHLSYEIPIRIRKICYHYQI